MNRIIAISLLLFLNASASAALKVGRVIRIDSDSFEIKTEKGVSMVFHLSEDVKKGKVQKNFYVHKFTEIQLQFEVEVDYHKDGEKLICTGIQITKRRGGS